MKAGVLNRKSAALLVLLAFIASVLLIGIPAGTVAQTVVATVAVGNQPHLVAVNEVTNRVYVSIIGGVSVINGESNEVVTRIFDMGTSYGIGVNQTTNKIYAADQSNGAVVVIDGATNSVANTINLPGASPYPYYVAVNEATNRIYVGDNNANCVFVIDGTENSIAATVPVGDRPEGISVNQVTNTIYVANRSGDTVSVINGQTNSVVATINVYRFPSGVAVYEAANKVFAAASGEGRLSVIDGATNTMKEPPISLGTQGTEGVCVNQSTGIVYAANSDSNSLSAVDGTSQRVLATIGVGDFPFGVDVNERTGRLYVANTADDTVSVLETGAPPPPPPIQPTSRTWGTDSIGVVEPMTTWYLAEGCTAAAGSFETWVLVQNPQSVPVDVALTYMTPSGKVDGPRETLSPNSRKSYNVANKVNDAWEVSTKVETTQPVIAERAMYGNNRTWAHDSIGAASPKTSWYMAEGCTSPGFETWVLVQNPNDTTADVTLTFMTPNGAVAGPQETLAPNSRKTYNVARTVGEMPEVSTKVESSAGVVAERAMYGSNRVWGTDSIGVPSPTNAWYLAEGCTSPGFATWVLVANPNETPAEITITYMTSSGPVEGPREVLAPNSRKSYTVAATVNNAWEVSTKVEATQPVIAERAMYGNNRTWAHDSIGAGAPSNVWYLAEGSTGSGFETWILVQNPNPQPALIRITYMTPNGAVAGPYEALPANSRKSYKVASTVPNTTEVSTRVEADIGVIAERAMYGDPK